MVSLANLYSKECAFLLYGQFMNCPYLKNGFLQKNALQLPTGYDDKPLAIRISDVKGSDTGTFFPFQPFLPFYSNYFTLSFQTLYHANGIVKLVGNVYHICFWVYTDTIRPIFNRNYGNH